MAGTWTKITVTGNVKDLDGIVAVMSMLDNGLMIEDYSDFSLNGMYGELVDESILNADRETVRVSLFVPEERNPLEYREFLETRLPALGISATISFEGINEDDWAESCITSLFPLERLLSCPHGRSMMPRRAKSSSRWIPVWHSVQAHTRPQDLLSDLCRIFLLRARECLT